jgi:hypothetical protein
MDTTCSYAHPRRASGAAEVGLPVRAAINRLVSASDAVSGLRTLARQNAVCLRSLDRRDRARAAPRALPVPGVPA